MGDEGERNIEHVISSALDRVSALLSTYKTGRAISEGVKTCICGKPNVGKSSLFNEIVGEESAIVTSIPGTTRDILRENVSFGGITLRLSDTAGMHESDDTVERFGIERAEREISSAELVLAVFDTSAPLTEEDERIIEAAKSSGAAVIAVLNKADAEENADVAGRIRAEFGKAVRISAKCGDGMDALAEEVGDLYGRGKIDLRRDAVIWDARQREILLHCRDSLSRAKTAVEGGDPLDCVCTLVEESMAYLSETDGRSVGEEIVNEVFKRFCVGK